MLSFYTWFNTFRIYVWGCEVALSLCLFNNKNNHFLMCVFILIKNVVTILLTETE